MNYPEIFRKIVDYFKLLPGVGEKTAQRYAFSLINLDEDKLTTISDTILNLKKEIKTCDTCGCLIESGKCPNCEDENNKLETICVVENQKNVFLFEKLGFLNMKFHVLGGLISPIDGINPDDIRIDKLLERIENEKISEIVLALRSGIEGNTTSLYIKKILENKNIKVTQIAQGIPIGTDMEYLDGLTLEMAINNRSEIS